QQGFGFFNLSAKFFGRGNPKKLNAVFYIFPHLEKLGRLLLYFNFRPGHRHCIIKIITSRTKQ
ncbi:hypothetical protein ACVGWK_03545, partial [Enterobacter sichuanensis]